MPSQDVPPFDDFIREELGRPITILTDVLKLSQGMRPIDDVKLTEVKREQIDTRHALGLLGLLRKGDMIEIVVALFIHRALQLTMTWVEIGKALEMTPQGAYKLYQKHMGEELAKHFTPEEAQ